MRIAFLSSEVVPFSKTGGLADVSGALPGALCSVGHEVAVVTPYYRSVRERDFPVETVLDALEVPVGLDGETEEVAVHRLMRDGGPLVYFLDHEPSFDRGDLYGEEGEDYEDNCERFALYSRGALEALKAVEFRPDVLHANDWQSALAVIHLSIGRDSDPHFASTRSLFTIHNLGYQGLFDAEQMPETGLPQERFNWQEVEFHGRLNLLKGALVHADALSTVSRRYSEEIQTKEYGAGLDGVLRDRAEHLSGIPNGIDVATWDPATDSHLPANFGPDDPAGKEKCKAALQAEAGLPVGTEPLLVGLVGRLAEQKGIDLLTDIIPELVSRPVQLVVLGTGSPEYEELLEKASAKHPERIRAWIRFDEGLAHRIEAGADVFLMPSRYEPCGLNQMYSMRYGTVPLVRATGGLADTVVDASAATLADGTATGFCFEKARAEDLLEAIDRSLALFGTGEAWARLVRICMTRDFSWGARAREYEELYGRIGRRPAG
ncbi:MAG: glycogen synthase GlgA [Planctomycetota bacterium]|jgi:starch synthase